MAMGRITRLFGAALAAAALLGCGDDDVATPPGPTPQPQPQPEPIVWGDCPEYFQTECATVEVPLRYDDPEGDTVPILIARRRSGAADAPQLWLLEGGPGGSGADFYELIDTLAVMLPTFDIYTLDHRGVGHSERLGCPAEEDPASPNGPGFTPEEWISCAASVEDAYAGRLDAFTTSNAARDLGHLIERTREPGQRTFIFGISYGTTWALRYLQLFPEQPAGVVLDSVVSPGVQFLSEFDTQYDPVAQKLADVCAADAACSARLGPDPWARVEEFYTKIDAGHCSQSGITRPLMRQVFAQLLQRWYARRYIMPLLYRLDRCDPEDIAIVENAVTVLFPPATGDGRGFSPVLQTHVAFSELWEEPPPDVAELLARDEAAYASPGLGPYLGAVFPSWPRYAHDEYANRWPETSVPILMLNGTMDPQTPIETAIAAEDALNGPMQTFITIPQAVHGAIGAPVMTPDVPPCGAQIIFSFLEDPEAPPSTECLSDLLPLTFDFSPDEVQLVFGTDDAWDNPQPIADGSADFTSAAPRIDAEAVQRTLQQYRFLGAPLTASAPPRLAQRGLLR